MKVIVSKEVRSLKKYFAIVVSLIGFLATTPHFPVFADTLSNKAGTSATSAHTTISLDSNFFSIAPGMDIRLGVRFDMEGEWHIYYKEPGDSGLPPTIDWQLPEGFTVGEVQWPPYKVHQEAGLSTNVYYDNVMLWAPVRVSDDVDIGELVTLVADVKWLACREICIPGQGTVSLTLPVTMESNALKDGDFLRWANDHEDAIVQNDVEELGLDFTEPLGAKVRLSNEGQASLSIVLALAFAFIGGLILNLMPCVLPVLSIKVLGLVKHANDPKAAWKNGLMFTLGVLVSFWLLAGLLLILRFAGQQIGWGFQFQSPLFLVFLSSLLFIFGLNLFGLFEVGTSLTSIESKVKKGGGLTASFMTGVLATAVATPCTAPFMGSALGFAIAQPPVISLLVFTALGLGMAFPYLMLAKFPSLLKFVPKPGPWMDTFKKALGFLLMMTVVWLLWVLGVQLGSHAIILMLVVFVLMGLLFWLYGLASHPIKPQPTLKVIALLFLGCVFFGAFAGIKQLPKTEISSPTDLVWQEYSPELIKKFNTNGTPVFLDFTAAWCLSCQVNERVTLSSPRVMKAFDDKGVVLVKADWTNYDPEITEALAAFGKNSIPFYVLYDRQGEAHVLPEIITPQIILDALEKL